MNPTCPEMGSSGIAMIEVLAERNAMKLMKILLRMLRVGGGGETGVRNASLEVN